MPPSSTFGLTSAPSRYLFFAREEEERLGSAYSKESDMTLEKQSTMNGNGLVQGIPIAFQNDNNKCLITIETTSETSHLPKNNTDAVNMLIPNRIMCFFKKALPACRQLLLFGDV